MTKKSSTETQLNVRLDKWLWAARFYKTRALARAMIENGKVKYNQQRCKPSRTVEVGAYLTISQGFDDKEIEVLELSDQRRSAPQAQLLYAETDESLKKRTEQAQLRKIQHSLNPHPETKPDKKQRRQLIQVKQKNHS
ncbi:ribosome-associated heat shock protein Hsp15 [Catenovulum sp. 2E275]|uniref:ribosome-associated heat shock protein Hsp15 n=1 Tax=Catenovulum sp. 2E275 TaxID=2980497 RepID=UPI0021D380F4|nr:ribosome-associated heat shock protein Hsp15 [Catenovulum sp. 2E275]MCU4674396.1 ribosome-associated heat shock protein Hsp15 [Catenovulum sp. 2E275]